ncbi:hypothetical protein BDV95DRAFT_595264 [Massariosphaeria phaeospora]|uniref:Uncharacterized protein n=1 Tax=Massariosphaeria phaeospora TaxID=100035 RepID=A0A7C8MDE4_9PLEO|nr:hypothetical protein BDV95DRAFT_595264 [Massariosphaeria phaeospora]
MSQQSLRGSGPVSVWGFAQGQNRNFSLREYEFGHVERTDQGGIWSTPQSRNRAWGLGSGRGAVDQYQQQQQYLDTRPYSLYGQQQRQQPARRLDQEPEYTYPYTPPEFCEWAVPSANTTPASYRYQLSGFNPRAQFDSSPITPPSAYQPPQVYFLPPQIEDQPTSTLANIPRRLTMRELAIMDSWHAEWDPAPDTSPASALTGTGMVWNKLLQTPVDIDHINHARKAQKVDLRYYGDDADAPDGVLALDERNAEANRVAREKRVAGNRKRVGENRAAQVKRRQKAPSGKSRKNQEPVPAFKDGGSQGRELGWWSGPIYWPGDP